MLSGTVSTMFFRTRYAAVATAASSDAVLPNRSIQKVRPVMLRRDRIDRVIDGPLNHPHVDLRCRRCSACRAWKPREPVIC